MTALARRCGARRLRLLGRDPREPARPTSQRSNVFCEIAACTPDERAAIAATPEARLATAIEAEILQRRLGGHWPHGAVWRPN